MKIKHLIMATISTFLIASHQWKTISLAEKATEEASKVQISHAIEYQSCQIDEPTYTNEMDVSWHSWQPTGKAAGVIPVALLELAEEYQISPVYAAAVFILETGWGESATWVKKNNPAGITCAKKYCAYETAEEGLQRMFELLSDYYSNGLTTVEQQRSLWSESEDTEKIVQLMNQLKEE